jgi:hypothetical protein
MSYSLTVDDNVLETRPSTLEDHEHAYKQLLKTPAVDSDDVSVRLGLHRTIVNNIMNHKHLVLDPEFHKPSTGKARDHLGLIDSLEAYDKGYPGRHHPFDQANAGMLDHDDVFPDNWDETEEVETTYSMRNLYYAKGKRQGASFTSSLQKVDEIDTTGDEFETITLMKPVAKAVDMGGHKLSIVPLSRPIIKLDFLYPEDAKRVAEMEKAASKAKTVDRVAQGRENTNHPTKKDESIGGAKHVTEQTKVTSNTKTVDLGAQGREKINHPTKKDENMGGKEDFDNDWFIVNAGCAENMGSGHEDEDWEKL